MRELERLVVSVSQPNKIIEALTPNSATGAAMSVTPVSPAMITIVGDADSEYSIRPEYVAAKPHADDAVSSGSGATRRERHAGRLDRSLRQLGRGNLLPGKAGLQVAPGTAAHST